MLGCGAQESKGTATMAGDCIQFVKGDRPWWAWAVEKVEKVTGKGLES